MGFSTCHPAINLLYFVCVICVALTIPHPIFLAVSVCCAFAYCLKVCKLRGLAFCLALVPCVLLFGNWYAGFTHFGITKLGENFIGNPMTAESLAYGLVLGGMVAAFCIWMACVHAIFTADKVRFIFY